ncbi:MAG: hypothetical protein EBR30_05040 [Cytophagia bacterium]|nr:hypothetical protein [Cytophagia bacterium]
MQKFFFTLSLMLALSVVYSNAQTRLYVDPNFLSIAGDHKIIAVVPFRTTISLRPKQLAALKEGQLAEMNEDESINIQNAMFAWFLTRRQQGRMWVDVQDVSTTNAILARNGITYDNMAKYSPQEIAKILEVDAIVKGTFDTDKPMSDGASLALGVLVGFWGATNKATINMFIYNAADGRAIVNYNKTVAGSVGSTTDQLINIVMRKASRRIPYTKPKV